MYEGLYDTQKGLSPKDAEVIGGMTARLMFPWRQWMHRCVDRVTFSDEDALCRDVSIDFTLPHWFHQLRSQANEPNRHLVPIGFFRKEALANFSLTDGSSMSLPLLTNAQTCQVAEAALVKLGEIVLGRSVPSKIAHDMHSLVRDKPLAAAATYKRLFDETDTASRLRKQLEGNPSFERVAQEFRDSFLALVMIYIRPHERKVIHYSFEEQLSDETTVMRLVEHAVGEPRRIAVGATAPSTADSYHLEVEAPDGLMFSMCQGFHHTGSGVVNFVPAGISRRRAHCHFSGVPAGSRAGAELFLQPRRSSVVRAATFMAVLTLIATSTVLARFTHIESKDNAAAAALLVAVTGIVGLIVIRSGEEEMATSLLFPLRVLATIPAALGILAAIVVVMDPATYVAYPILGMICGLIGLTIGVLIRCWRKADTAMMAGQLYGVS